MTENSPYTQPKTPFPFPSVYIQQWRIRFMIGSYEYIKLRRWPRLYVGRCSHDTAVQMRVDWFAHFTCIVFTTKRLNTHGVP